jgi:putative addiction module CopG family antidote
MQVKLPVHLQQFVRQLVAEGQYPSTDAVIAAAITAFAQQELQRLVDEGIKDIEKGRVSDWDVEEAKQRLLRRLKRKQQKAT